MDPSSRRNSKTFRHSVNSSIIMVFYISGASTTSNLKTWEVKMSEETLRPLKFLYKWLMEKS